MPSPFPGMNPYLEQNDAWRDFHQSFLLHARESLTGEVGPNYFAKIEVRLLLHELSAEERRFFAVADLGLSAVAEQPANATATVEAPVTLQMPAVEIEKHVSLEIRDIRNRRVVTVIELLSPSNKTAGEDRDDYLAKRRGILAGNTNLVEIDLLRGGVRPTPPELPPCDYCALVWRHEDRRHVGFWPIGLREPLPVLPIPLAGDDPPVRLDLKAVLDRAYDAAGYGKYIYQDTPEPLLSPADQTWAEQFIRRAPAAG